LEDPIFASEEYKAFAARISDSLGIAATPAAMTVTRLVPELAVDF
jgi:hypothetical protein